VGGIVRRGQGVKVHSRGHGNRGNEGVVLWSLAILNLELISYRLQSQRFFKEALLWKRLDHPNILSFRGVSISQGQLCVVSSWIENGNILEYTRKNPEVNRLHLVTPSVGVLLGKLRTIILQLAGVASGLEYLHRVNLVHGNIRGVRPR
jgi:serine/threonine protein kinase